MTKCSILQTSTQPESECEVCPMGPPLDDRATGGGSLFLAHLLDLRLMVDSGCRFSVNDLTWEEWEGLKYFQIERNLLQAEAQKKADEANRFKPTHRMVK